MNGISLIVFSAFLEIVFVEDICSMFNYLVAREWQKAKIVVNVKALCNVSLNFFVTLHLTPLGWGFSCHCESYPLTSLSFPPLGWANNFSKNWIYSFSLSLQAICLINQRVFFSMSLILVCCHKAIMLHISLFLISLMRKKRE